MLQIIVTVMGIVMSLGYYPQAWRIYKSKSAKDISLLTYTIFALGTTTWLLYGLYLGDMVIILSFLMGVIGSFLVLSLAIYYRKR